MHTGNIQSWILIYLYTLLFFYYYFSAGNILCFYLFFYFSGYTVIWFLAMLNFVSILVCVYIFELWFSMGLIKFKIFLVSNKNILRYCLYILLMFALFFNMKISNNIYIDHIALLMQKLRLSKNIYKINNTDSVNSNNN